MSVRVRECTGSGSWDSGERLRVPVLRLPVAGAACLARIPRLALVGHDLHTSIQSGLANPKVRKSATA